MVYTASYREVRWLNYQLCYNPADIDYNAVFWEVVRESHHRVARSRRIQFRTSRAHQAGHAGVR